MLPYRPSDEPVNAGCTFNPDKSTVITCLCKASASTTS